MDEKEPSIYLGTECVFISRRKSLRRALRLRRPLCLLTEQGARWLKHGKEERVIDRLGEALGSQVTQGFGSYEGIWCLILLWFHFPFEEVLLKNWEFHSFV